MQVVQFGHVVFSLLGQANDSIMGRIWMDTKGTYRFTQLTNSKFILRIVCLPPINIFVHTNRMVVYLRLFKSQNRKLSFKCLQVGYKNQGPLLWPLYNEKREVPALFLMSSRQKYNATVHSIVHFNQCPVPPYTHRDQIVYTAQYTCHMSITLWRLNRHTHFDSHQHHILCTTSGAKHLPMRTYYINLIINRI